MIKNLKNEIELALKRAFLHWLDEKQKYIQDNKNLNLEYNKKELLQWQDYDIDMIDKCIKTILEQGFPPEAMKLICNRINYYYSDWIPKQAPVICKTEFECENDINALEWTIVNIKELNFFDMSDLKFKLPYNQCYYCGKPNGFEHKTGYKNFNKKRKYCHILNCEKIHDANGSNPKEHENCCFGKFALEKKKLYEQIRRTKNKEEINDKVKLFIDYCNKRFEENLNIKWSIQTKYHTSVYEDDWDDEINWK